MNKFVVAFWLLSSLQALSQSPTPAFGEIIPDEIKLKVCEFDKAADAVILLDKAVSTYDGDNHLITKRRIKFKILKESGIHRGDIHIPYYSSDEFEKIEDLEAYVLNTNEIGGFNKTFVDKKSIYTSKKNELYSEIKFAMPDLKVGSIVEYQYTSVKKSFYGIRDWYFQTDIPTVFSQYDLTIQPGVSFAYKIVKSKMLKIDIKSIKDEGRIIFEMKNVGGLRDEPFMDAPTDYLQRVVFQLAEYRTYYGTNKKVANSWPELAQDLLQDEDFGKAIEKNIKGADELVASVNALSSEYARMKYLFLFVCKEFRWNGIYSHYASEGLKKVWDKKSGNAAEINLLLINLLKEVKLEVFPLLVSERDHGRVDGSYPFLDQFNKVVALVVANGKRYVLDATDESTPPGMIPFDLLNTNAFVVVKKSAAVFNLADDTRSMKNFTNIQSEMDENGIVKGIVQVSSFDYSRLERRTDLKRESKEKFIVKYFQKEISNIQIDSLEVNNAENDSLSLDQKFHFIASSSASGDYRLVNLNIFGSSEKSPFVADNRFTSVNFGSQYLNSTTQALRIPATMEPESIPANISLVMPDKSITLSRITAYDKATNMFTARIQWQINRPVFEPEEYPAIKEFFKKMVDLLNEPLVLKKK